jgi:hypothetical protein
VNIVVAELHGCAEVIPQSKNEVSATILVSAARADA